MSGHKKFSELRARLEKKLGRPVRRVQEIDPAWEVDSDLTQEQAYERLTYVQAHCDSRVLHEPSFCDYCDKYPEAQNRRWDLRVNFTGNHWRGWFPCPAEAARGIDSINAWRGNTPHGSGVPEDLQRHLKEIESPASKMMYGWLDIPDPGEEPVDPIGYDNWSK